MRAAITQFTGEYEFLSNFFFCEVVFDGLMYKTVEHAYQAAKTLDPAEREIIRGCLVAAGAKWTGKRVTLRPDWEKVRVDLMRQFLREKFTRDPRLTKRLLDTEDALLVEGNHWHDQLWGNCTCPQHAETPGQNLLGLLLMQVRDELQRGTTA